MANESNKVTAFKRGALGPYLFSELARLGEYPVGVGPVSKLISGTAFFPGGSGVWEEPGAAPDLMPDIMVLGQDFSTVDEHLKMLNGGVKDIKSATWKNFILLAGTVGLDLNRCFFTNAWMGLRKEGLSTGQFPGHDDADFAKRNGDFLRLQISTIKPKLIIVMGKWAPMVLARLSDDLTAWREFEYSKVDKANAALLPAVEIDGVSIACASIVHTSMRRPNFRWRRYGIHQGEEAERQLLIDALALL